MTAEEFLALWLVLTITVGYLGLVALWCLLLPRFIRWVMRQDLDVRASGKPGRSTGEYSPR
jgi:hypothetical protein